jgi:AcrR family transcriptional regulator
MRTRGWGGEIPANDEEAVARILEATRRTIDERGEQTSISDVARTLGVTRQTIYHYFTSTEDLLSATAIDGAGPFLDHLVNELKGITDPGDAVVEGIAIVLERLEHDPYVGLLVRSHRSGTFAENVTADAGRKLGRFLLDSMTIDWTEFDNRAADDILEMILRSLQSLILAPMPTTGSELRRFLRRWIAPAVTAMRTTGSCT